MNATKARAHMVYRIDDGDVRIELQRHQNGALSITGLLFSDNQSGHEDYTVDFDIVLGADAVPALLDALRLACAVSAEAQECEIVRTCQCGEVCKLSWQACPECGLARP